MPLTVELNLDTKDWRIEKKIIESETYDEEWQLPYSLYDDETAARTATQL